MDTAKTKIDNWLEESWSLRNEKPTQSRQLARQAYEQCQANGYEHGAITAIRTLCEHHSNAHEYEPALALLTAAIALLQKAEHAEHPAAFHIYLLTSNVNIRLGNTTDALAYCYRAEALALANKDLSGQAAVLRAMGNVHILSGAHAKAITAYDQAYQIYQALEDVGGMATMLNNMCHTHHQCGQFTEALRTGLAGLQLFEAQDLPGRIPNRVYAYNLNNVGTTYLNQGAYDTAVTHFKKAYAIFAQESDLYGEIYSVRGLAQIHFTYQQYDEAFPLFHQALALAEKSEILAELVTCHLALANAYEEIGQHQQALLHYKKYLEFEKNILNHKTEKKFSNLEAAYKIEKAEQAAAFYQLKNVALRKEVKKRKKAEKAADAAARAKAEFLANMSHEIRTPLNGIIGVTELLRSTPLEPQQQELTDIIQASGETLLRIINDILDFSKIEAGKLELEMAPYFLRQVVEAAIDLLAPKAAEKGLTLGYIMAPTVQNLIVGDMLRFKQILLNLLSNGVKFTEHGEVFVHLQSKLLTADTAEIHVTVMDSGIGIHPAEMKRLFSSFSQVDSSTTRKYGGTGLGLTISQQLAELMGGRMWVESVPGQGSAFHFTIQVGVERLAEDETDDEINELAGRQVVVAIPHENGRLALIQQLASCGIQPITALSGSHIAALVQQEPIEAILLDYQPSQQLHDTLAYQIWQALGAACPPLLAIVPRTGAEIPLAFFAGALAQPIRLDTLREQLQKVLTNKRVRQPAAAGGTAPAARLRPLTILVAEDNAVNQKVMQKILRNLGYEPIIAENGQKALALLAQRPFDVVLMDIQMPEMDGITATREIYKRFAEGERPYIIAMTAHALQGDREKLLEVGMDDYLSKPVRIESLTLALQKIPQKP